MNKRLIEAIAEESGYMISDLHIRDIQLKTLPYVWASHDYPLEEWKKLINYVLQDEYHGDNEEDAKGYYAGKVMKAILDEQDKDSVYIINT